MIASIPMPIKTNRLLIKPRFNGEGKIIYNSVMENLEHLKPWMPWAHQLQSPESSEEMCINAIKAFEDKSDFVLSIYDLKGLELIGSTGIHKPNWKVPSFMLGYWIGKKFEGQGFVTEAVNALTLYCIEQLKAKRVYITCDSKNFRSIAVVERLGFMNEGLLKNESRDPFGQLRDTCIYAKYEAQDLIRSGISW